MNFGSLFRGLSNFQLPYSIENDPYHETSQWQLFEARSKKTETLDKHVTVFRPKAGADRRFILNGLQCAKRIRFPGLCNVLDVMDGSSNGNVVDERTLVMESVLIVTEFVKPVDDSLKLCAEAICMGIWDLCQALDLLTSKFVIGNLSERSIFYNESGEWVLFGLECCKPVSEVQNGSDMFGLEVERFNGSRMRGTPQKWDMQSLGYTLIKLLTQIYGSKNKIPSEWIHLLDTQSKNGSRGIKPFLTSLQMTKTWNQCSTIIQNYIQLKELHVSSEKIKVEIISNFNCTIRDHLVNDNSDDWLKEFTPGFFQNLIVPELCTMISWMIQQQQQQQNGSLMYQSTIVMSVALLLEYIIATETRTQQTDELLWSMWRLSDREIRCLLLMHCHNILQNDKISGKNFQFSDKVFPSFLQGLGDSEESLRLLTLKNIPCIVQLLTDRQLNNELLRSIAKTQVDPSIQVRTETLLVVSRIAPELSALTNRDAVLATIFTKSLKDPNSETRLAALYGLEQCLPLFGSEVIANKIMSVIAPGLLDSDSGIRKSARILFDKYLNKLETAAKEKFGNNSNNSDKNDISKKPLDIKKFDRSEKDETNEMDQMCIEFLRGLKISSTSQINLNETQSGTFMSEMQPKLNSSQLSFSVVNSNSNNANNNNSVVNIQDDEGDDGWGDFDDIPSDVEETPVKTRSPAAVINTTNNNEGDNNDNEEEDDDDDGWDAADW